MISESPRENGRCPDCGNVTLRRDMATDTVRCGYLPCPSNAKDLVPPAFVKSDNPGIVIEPKLRHGDFTKDLGPVRLPTREEAMRDSRKLLWHPMPCPEDRTVILTRSFGTEHVQWLVQRHPPGDSTFIYGKPATHWAEDTLGTP